jgi:son of sevenless-like protein
VKAVDIEFREAFLSTYRSFTDASTLINLLPCRYEMPEPLNLSPDEFEDWKIRKLRPVQMQYV